MLMPTFAAKVAVKQFGKIKGKGLVATEIIEPGEEVWKEDPFIVSPEWSVLIIHRSESVC